MTTLDYTGLYMTTMDYTDCIGLHWTAHDYT